VFNQFLDRHSISTEISSGFETILHKMQESELKRDNERLRADLAEEKRQHEAELAAKDRQHEAELVAKDKDRWV
jgi:hypothetical protein